MAIYTKTGDKGHTSIFGGRRVAKSHPQVQGYGTIDELTSQIGLVAAMVEEQEEKEFLLSIQRDLWQMMSLLAGADVSITEIAEEIEKFEKKIDKLEQSLPKLTRFILPGGTPVSAQYHIVRTICRRSEREVVQFFLSETPHNIPEESESIMLQYLNRLSDLFFMLARKHNNGVDITT